MEDVRDDRNNGHRHNPTVAVTTLRATAIPIANVHTGNKAVVAYDHDTTLPNEVQTHKKLCTGTSARLQVGLVPVAASSAMSPMATREI